MDPDEATYNEPPHLNLLCLKMAGRGGGGGVEWCDGAG